MRDTLPDEKTYLDALSHYDSEPQGNPNHSEDCSFEAFKAAADTLIETVSGRAKTGF